MEYAHLVLAHLHPVLGKVSGIPLVVLLIVFGLTGAFIVGYVVKGTQVGIQLWLAVRRVRALRQNGKVIDPVRMGEIFLREPFKHLWDEYKDTLHELHKARSGNAVLTEVRATLPAEMFFTKDVLVDSRLFDDFGRHLPGVLTGLGIIGTFAGLLEGLSKFDATSTQTAVAGLKPLLDGVAHAFVASAIAIACAMFITFASRFLLALFYRLVEKLNHAIDSLYSTGAGEEYLSRLVQASEKSEAHAAQLKQALVEDLTKLMTNLVDRQIEAQLETTRSLGSEIGAAIKNSLEDPIKRMTGALEQTSKGNSDAVTGMLENMLTGFMTRLDDTFGGQMRGIRDQMDRSMGAMTSVQQALQKLIEDINQSNEKATSRMSGTIEESMKQAAANQQLLTDQMRQFVQDFRKVMTAEQDQSKRHLDAAMSKMIEQVTMAVGQLEEGRRAASADDRSRSDELSKRTSELLSGLAANVDTTVRALGAQVASSTERMEAGRRTAAEDEGRRNSEFTSRTQEMMGGLSSHIEALVRSVSEQVTATQRNIEAIGSVATRAIDGMNSGALNMGTAAQRFETAGGAITSVFNRSATVSEQMASTATTLQSAASAVRQGFEQYDSVRQTVDASISSLVSLIENAKKEAGLSRQLISDLDRIVTQLKAAETQSLQYLEGVNRTLAKAFEDFGSALANQVKKAIGETDRHLGGGVQQLNGVVQEIGSALARLKRA